MDFPIQYVFFSPISEKFSEDEIVFTTLLGGSSFEYAYSVKLYYPISGEPASLVFMSGVTHSNNVPIINQIPGYSGGGIDLLVAAYTTNGFH